MKYRPCREKYKGGWQKAAGFWSQTGFRTSLRQRLQMRRPICIYPPQATVFPFTISACMVHVLKPYNPLKPFDTNLYLYYVILSTPESAFPLLGGCSHPVTPVPDALTGIVFAGQPVGWTRSDRQLFAAGSHCQ
ncbi:MAG: hypothetical protein AMJ54_01300 [Deltaproteobacteria bacterium SG8_13]|nr:MAG: hypothetical protein AMJ54_01300 [Deltaproteobacteria bacterium SG8_13]